MEKTILILFAAAILSSCSCSCSNDGNVASNDDMDKYICETYVNPVIKHNCPDPTVLDDRERSGYFYAYSTQDGDKNLPIWRSKDFVNWEYAADAFDSESRPSWRENARLWAPDINYVDGKYILYYAMGIWGGLMESASGVAVSDSPTGPFKDMGMVVGYENTGVLNSIDPVLFRDDDGSNYIFWGSLGEGSGVWGAELQEDCLKLKEGAKPFQVGNTGMEGTFILKRDGYYYIFGSMGSCCEGENSSYHVVVARSKDIRGPYEGPSGEKLLDRKYRHTILQSWSDKTFVGPGHNAQVITDDSGQDWLPYHVYFKGNGYKGRCMAIEKIEWTNGWPHTPSKEPTSGGKGPKWLKEK